jgi:hypothetical protein
MSEGYVSLPAKEICRLADDIKTLEMRVRQLGTEGFTSKPPTSQAITIDDIDWWFKEKDTGKNRPANLEDKHAWTFAALKDGTIPEGRKTLLAYLDRYGKAKIQGYDITRSKDGKFLQRTKET